MSSSSSSCGKPQKANLTVDMDSIGPEKFKLFTTAFEGPAGFIKIRLNERYEKQRRRWTEEGIILENTLLETKVTRSNDVKAVLDELHIFLLKETCQDNVTSVLSAMGLNDRFRYPTSLYRSLKNHISEYVLEEARRGFFSRGMESFGVVVDVEIVMVEEVDDEEDLVVVVSRSGNRSKWVRRVYEKERLEKSEYCGFCRKKIMGMDNGYESSSSSSSSLLMDEEEEKVVRMPCSHVLHVNCLAQQMKVNYICPVRGCGEVIG